MALGNLYRVVAFGWLCLPLVAGGAPANDAFVNRHALSGTNATALVSMMGASVEAGEPAHFGAARSRSVWWTWTSPAEGMILLSARQSDFFGSVTAVYTGSSVDNLVRVAEGVGDACVQVAVEGNVAYHIVVADNGSGDDSAVLALQWFPHPANDQFISRTVLAAAAPVAVLGWTLGATSEPNEPGVASTAQTVWWVWTAPASGRATARLTSVRCQAQLQVVPFTDPPQLPWLIPGMSASETSFEARAGSNYLCRVASSAGLGSVFELGIDLSTFAIIAPQSNALFSAAASIDIQLHVTQFDQPIGRVELYAGDVLLATLNSDPWQHTWINPSRGEHVLTAVLFSGVKTVTSDPVPIVIGPGNDLFAHRVQIDERDFVVSGDFRGATIETGEPRHGSYSDLERSLWWSWTAPESGLWQIAVTNHGSSDALVIYTGAALAQLTRVAGGQGIHEPLRVRVTGGQTYHIAAAAHYWSTGILTIASALFLPPDNDNFANREIINETVISVTTSTIAANAEPGEPRHDGSDAARSVWWSWTAPSNGVLRLSATSVGVGPAVAVYTGSTLENLSQISSARYSQLYVQVQAGTTYHIAVDQQSGFSDGTSSDVHLHLRFSPAPSNDDFVNRTSLSGLPVAVLADNTAATIEANEPQHGGVAPAKTLWWSWTAPASVRVSARTEDCCFVTGIYEGDHLDNLMPVAGADAFSFAAEIGRTYAIAVGAHSIPGGPLTLRLDFSPNDDFAERFTLVGNSNTISSANFAATAEPGEPDHGGLPAKRTMWWTWQAPHSGTVSVQIYGYGTVVGIYTGEELASLVEVTNVSARHFGPPVFFDAVAGTRYHIVVGSWTPPGYGDFAGNYSVTLVLNAFHLASPPAGFVATAPTPIPLRLGPVVAESDGVIGEVSFFARRFDHEYADQLLGAIADPGGTLTHFFDKPGEYRVFAVATNDAGTLRKTMEVPIILRPINDDFEDRINVTGTDITVTGLVTEATFETDEPRPPFASWQGSAWWSWTAPESGRYIFIARNTGLRVYTGQSLNSLQIATGNEGLLIHAVAGTEYQVQTLTIAAYLPVGFEIRRVVAPLNDDFTNRTHLTGADVMVTTTTLGATREPGEPHFHEESTSVSVWYSWTAPSEGRLSIQLLEPTGAIYIYTGDSLSSLTSLLGESEWKVSIPAEQGLAYHIAVTGHPASIYELPIQLRFVPRPANDDFVNATVVSGTPAFLSGSTLLATIEPGEPASSDGTFNASIWWSWTAPISGNARLAFTNSATRPFIEVFEGPALTTLTSLFERTTYFNPPGFFRFRVEEGHTYHISASALEDTGDVALELRVPPPPANDNFQSAQLLVGNSAEGEGDLFNATFEAGEPPHRDLPLLPSVWYRWQAPATGRARFSTISEVAVSVYTGDAFSTLRRIAEKDLYGDWPAEFAANAGVVYYIGAVSHSRPYFPFQFSFHTAPANDLFEHRVLIQGSSAEMPISFEGAAVEPEFVVSAADLWWTWRAPAFGRATFSVSNDFTEAECRVYYGDSRTNLRLIDSKYGLVTFEAIGGRWYHFRAMSWATDTNATLRFYFLPQSPPVLRAVAEANGFFTVELRGEPGNTCLIETSTNLLDWSFLDLHTFYGSTYLHGPTPADDRHQFYRTRPPH